MQLESKLKKICDEVDGSTGAFFCGFDGMMIAKYELRQADVDMDLVAANFASVIKNLKDVSDIIATFKTSIVAIKISQDGFIGILMSKDGNLGRLKLELNRVGDFLNG
jgi:predicted regulator of Ras-like GTPase activity (Roadblock/LC7/MglB family)